MQSVLQAPCVNLHQAVTLRKETLRERRINWWNWQNKQVMIELTSPVFKGIVNKIIKQILKIREHGVQNYSHCMKKEQFRHSVKQLPWTKDVSFRFGMAWGINFCLEYPFKSRNISSLRHEAERQISLLGLTDSCLVLSKSQGGKKLQVKQMCLITVPYNIPSLSFEGWYLHVETSRSSKLEVINYNNKYLK